MTEISAPNLARSQNSLGLAYFFPSRRSWYMATCVDSCTRSSIAENHKKHKKKKRNPCEKRHLTVEFAIYRLCYSYVKRKKCRCSKIWRCAYRFMVIIIFQQVNQLPSTPYHSLICLYGFFFRASAQQRTYINISKMLTALLSFIAGWNVCDAGPNCTVRNFTDIKCIDLILLFFVIAIVIGRDSFISRLAYTHPSSQNDHAYICNIKHNHLFEILQLFVYD